MIDESILDEIIPVPDADAKMQELKESWRRKGLPSPSGAVAASFTG